MWLLKFPQLQIIKLNNEGRKERSLKAWNTLIVKRSEKNNPEILTLLTKTQSFIHTTFGFSWLVVILLKQTILIIFIFHSNSYKQATTINHGPWKLTLHFLICRYFKAEYNIYKSVHILRSNLQRMLFLILFKGLNATA